MRQKGTNTQKSQASEGGARRGKFMRCEGPFVNDVQINLGFLTPSSLTAFPVSTILHYGIHATSSRNPLSKLTSFASDPSYRMNLPRRAPTPLGFLRICSFFLPHKMRKRPARVFLHVVKLPLFAGYALTSKLPSRSLSFRRLWIRQLAC